MTDSGPQIAGEDYSLADDPQFRGMMGSGLKKLVEICHPFMKKAGQESFHFKGGFQTESDEFRVELLVVSTKKPVIYNKPTKNAKKGSKKAK